MLEARIRTLAEAPGTPPAAARRPLRQRLPGWVLRAALALAPRYRRPLGTMARSVLAFLFAARELGRACLARPSRPAAMPEGRPVEFRQGDWLVQLGASWHAPYRPVLLSRLAAAGARYAVLAHDMIPDLFPEWCTGAMVRDFSHWLDEIVPRADLVFAVSRNTARDVERSLAARGRRVPPTALLPVGAAPFPPAAAPLVSGPYVLMVGTIEARKNHAGMLRVWRRLVAALGAARVPTLVIAGKQGWLTDDFIRQLENANGLNGKIRRIDRPSEPELAALYAHCLFTVFPSFYEGWGLPVTESLSFGKPVAASARSAIPEAGGDFCAYFDPDDLSAAYALIRHWIETPAEVTALARNIAAEFHPPGWEDTALALCAALAAPGWTLVGVGQTDRRHADAGHAALQQPQLARGAL